MTVTLSTVASLSDDVLLGHVATLAARERHATAELIASLAELDARRLYLGAGCSSLFTYCTYILHLSEHAAYRRIEAARLARRFPEVLDRLDDGSLTLTALCLVGPVLTEVNAAEVLDAARHKTKREVEHLVARIRPLPAVTTSVRKLPDPRAVPVLMMAGTSSPTSPPLSTESGPAIAPAIVPSPRPPVVRPLSAETYKVQFTLSGEGHRHLRRAQDLLRHSVPNGDIGRVIERALELLVQDLERRKLAATEHPRLPRRSRRVTRQAPAAVRREVWQRDGGQCAFVGTARRCTERGFLELHHVIPFAEGGDASAGNIQLRCRAHNQHEATRWFGADIVESERSSTVNR
jgi:hypothetical protein